jgi:hypothetical protein
MNKKFKEQSKRIEIIFNNTFGDISRNLETLAYYKAYLITQLGFPVRLTGVEDFDWEEFYIMGPGDKCEYEELKLTRASYRDIFNMTSIDSNYDAFRGLFARVTRLRDKKKFRIPLMDLKAVDKNSAEWQFLDDYSVWCINS